MNNFRIPFALSLTICIVFIGCCLIQSYSHPPHDFSNSYFAGFFLLNGAFDVSCFDPYAFNRKILDAGFPGIFASFSPNPPFTAIFFVPFALLPLVASKLAFNVITAALFLVSTYRFCRHSNVEPSFVFLCIPFVFIIPLRNEILFGQTYFLILFLLIEGFIAYDKKQIINSSLFWAIAIFLKVFPVIIFLFLAWRKDWKNIIYLSIVCLALLLFSVALQGIEVWREFLFSVLPRSNQGEISSAYTTNYQSALMLFKYLFIKDELLNPYPLVSSFWVFAIGLILFKSIVLAACIAVITKSNAILAFGFTLFCGMLISPYSSTYGNIILIILLIAVFRENNKPFLLITLALLFMISNLPISIFQHLPLPLPFPRLMLLILLFVVTLYFVKIKPAPVGIIFFLSLLSVSVLLKTRQGNDPSKRLLADEHHTLIFDYGISNNFVFYRFWSEEGESICDTKIPGESLDSANLSISNNQIFYKGNRLTQTSDKKSKAAVLDGKSIIYLSDKDKGIGFYTLRGIALPNE